MLRSFGCEFREMDFRGQCVATVSRPNLIQLVARSRHGDSVATP